MHPTAPAWLHFPAGHASAAGVADVDATLHAYPALQLVQDVAPAMAYVPAGHSLPTGDATRDPAAHKYPALHWPSQDGELRPLDAPYRPPGHGTHDDDPPRLY